MRNRAKCKICGDIIESFHTSDIAECKCGEINVWGGNAMRCSATDFANFLRVDDEGNEIIVNFKQNQKSEFPKLSKKHLIEMLEDLIKNIESLPNDVMTTPITHYDYVSLLMLLVSIFRVDES